MAATAHISHGTASSVELTVEPQATLVHTLQVLQEKVNEALTGMLKFDADAADLPDAEALDSDDEKQLEAEIAALEQPTKRPREK